MKLDIIKSFKDKKVLLVGDTLLDVYIYGRTVAVAADAPVPELEEDETKIFFGGNALVANHILELGGQLTFITVLGKDEDAKHYDRFHHPKLKKIFLIDSTRRTTVKRRWYDGKKLLQVNKVDNHYLSRNLERKILGYVEKEAKNADVIVAMDPQHGVMTVSLIKNIIALSKKYQKPFYIDTQVSHRKSNHHWYKGAHTIFLNEKEAKAVYPNFSAKVLKESLSKIQKKLKIENVIIKLGKQGSAALIDGRYIRTKPYEVQTVDVCGAGDAFLAAFSLGDQSLPEESLRMANAWGALSTTIHGTMPPRKKDLAKILKERQV